MSLSRFDKLFFIFLLAALFTVGLHIGGEKSGAETVSFTAEVSYEKLSGDPCDEGGLMVDGRLPVQVTGFDGEYFYITMDGYLTEAGFLLCGAKYLSANQPVFIYGEVSGIEGKICRLYPANEEQRPYSPP